jgi:hypothetical protein
MLVRECTVPYAGIVRIGPLYLEVLEQLFGQLRIPDRTRYLNPTVEVAWQPVTRSNEDFRACVITEHHETTVFEVPTDDANRFDPFRNSSSSSDQ